MRVGAVWLAVLCLGSFSLGCGRVPAGNYVKVDHLESSGTDTKDSSGSIVSETELHTAIYPGAKQVPGGNSTVPNGSLSTKIVAFTTQDHPSKVAIFYSENLTLSESREQVDMYEIDGTNEANDTVKVTIMKKNGEPTQFMIQVTTQTK